MYENIYQRQSIVATYYRKTHGAVPLYKIYILLTRYHFFFG